MLLDREENEYAAGSVTALDALMEVGSGVGIDAAAIP